MGFIPTEWYTLAVAVADNDLLIATGKGLGTGPNAADISKVPSKRKRLHPYIPTLLHGSIARINLAEIEKNLPAFTRVAQEQMQLLADPTALPFHDGANPIHHVIYIIKENRTYDQIFGDLKVGNGDPSLTLYGADITPNEHKLALQFGVLDNFYDSGEVSGDGHMWSTAAIAGDYNEKTWQIAYRSRERTYDFEGMVADEYPLEHDEPDVNEPGTGYLWGNVARHGLSYRHYGEFVASEWCGDKFTRRGFADRRHAISGRWSLRAQSYKAGRAAACGRWRSEWSAQSLSLADSGAAPRRRYKAGIARAFRSALRGF